MRWCTEQPLSEIPDDEIRQIFMEHAEFLLDDLKQNYREWEYEKDKYDNDRIQKRRILRENPPWYQERLWSSTYMPIGRNNPGGKNTLGKYSRRRPHGIRRNRALSSLERLVNCNDKPFAEELVDNTKGYNKIDTRFRDLIFERLTKGYEYQGQEISANGKVCKYFGKIYRKPQTEKNVPIEIEDELPF